MKHPGPVIRRIRKERGILLVDLATSARYDKGGLSRLERGEIGVNLRHFVRIAVALGVDPRGLLGELLEADEVGAAPTGPLKPLAKVQPAEELAGRMAARFEEAERERKKATERHLNKVAAFTGATLADGLADFPGSRGEDLP